MISCILPFIVVYYSRTYRRVCLELENCTSNGTGETRKCLISAQIACRSFGGPARSRTRRPFGGCERSRTQVRRPFGGCERSRTRRGLSAELFQVRRRPEPALSQARRGSAIRRRLAHAGQLPRAHRRHGGDVPQPGIPRRARIGRRVARSLRPLARMGRGQYGVSLPLRNINGF